MEEGAKCPHSTTLQFSLTTARQSANRHINKVSAIFAPLLYIEIEMLKFDEFLDSFQFGLSTLFTFRRIVLFHEISTLTNKTIKIADRILFSI